MFTNNVDTTQIHCYKHPISEVNRDLSSRVRSAKKCRIEEMGTMEPLIPGTSRIDSFSSLPYENIHRSTHIPFRLLHY